MANPLMNNMNNPQMGINPQALQSIKQMMSAFKNMSNPQQALMQMAQQNPQINSVMQMLNGRNPKDMFMEECQKRGIDPNTIINQLK